MQDRVEYVSLDVALKTRAHVYVNDDGVAREWRLNGVATRDGTVPRGFGRPWAHFDVARKQKERNDINVLAKSWGARA